MRQILLVVISVAFLAWPAAAQMVVGSGGGSGGGQPTDDPTDHFASHPVFSVGTTATELDNGGTITVASNIATFSIAFPVNVGVGDVVQYDVDNDGAIEAGEWGIIRGITEDRTKAYLLKTNGSNVADTAAATSTYDIFRAYTSLTNWETSTENTNVDADVRTQYGLTDLDLTDADDESGPEYVAIYGGGSVISSYLTIKGRTTDDAHYIHIFAPHASSMVGASQRHAGVYDDSKALILNNDDHGATMVVTDLHIRFTGLQIVGVGGSGGVDLTPASSGAYYEFDACILRCASGNGYDYGINANGNSERKLDLVVKNSILEGWSDGGNNSMAVRLRPSTPDSVVNIYNSTICDNYYGISCDNSESSPAVTVTNCAIFNNVDDLVGAITASYCAIDDGDAGTGMVNISPGGDEAADWANAVADYVNGDFSLKSGSPLIDAGTDLSAYMDAVDIIGTERPQGSAWDIGAWELIP